MFYYPPSRDLPHGRTSIRRVPRSPRRSSVRRGEQRFLLQGPCALTRRLPFGHGRNLTGAGNTISGDSGFAVVRPAVPESPSLGSAGDSSPGNSSSPEGHGPPPAPAEISKGAWRAKVLSGADHGERNALVVKSPQAGGVINAPESWSK